DNQFLFRQDSPTIIKRRFIENYFFSKLFEVYEINDSVLSKSDVEQLCRTLRGCLRDYDVVIVFDFGHGMLSAEAIDILCQESSFLAVNTQSNAGNLGYHTISKYPRADYVCIAENEMRLDARDRRGELRTMVWDLAERINCQRVVVTRG